ncbi:hypothetical protein ACC807_37840, partial [Rhizobium ruizarguesonis]
MEFGTAMSGERGWAVARGAGVLAMWWVVVAGMGRGGGGRSQGDSLCQTGRVLLGWWGFDKFDFAVRYWYR